MNFVLMIIALILAGALFYIVKDPSMFLVIMIALAIEKILDTIRDVDITKKNDKFD